MTEPLGQLGVSELRRVADLNVRIRNIGRELEEDREEPFLDSAERRNLQQAFMALIRERNAIGGED